MELSPTGSNSATDLIEAGGRQDTWQPPAASLTGVCLVPDRHTPSSTEDQDCSDLARYEQRGCWGPAKTVLWNERISRLDVGS